MPQKSKIILAETTYPDHVREDRITETGSPFRGDGYYGRSDGFHTVQYALTGVVGTLQIQATLSLEPEERDWFTVIEKNFGMEDEEQLTEVENFVGNYVWVRARITGWTDGTVEYVMMNN